MSALLKDLLEASGVSPRDVSEAISEARGAVQWVEKWSGVAGQVARHTREQAKREGIQKGAAFVELAAEFVNQKAGEMLGKGRK